MAASNVPEPAAVARALTLSGFACQSVCIVRKSDESGSNAHPSGARLLALGHNTEGVAYIYTPAGPQYPPSEFELVKVSPYTAKASFSPFRALQPYVLTQRDALLELALCSLSPFLPFHNSGLEVPVLQGTA